MREHLFCRKKLSRIVGRPELMGGTGTRKFQPKFRRAAVEKFRPRVLTRNNAISSPTSQDGDLVEATQQDFGPHEAIRGDCQ